MAALQKVRKNNPCPNFEARWAVLAKQKHYKNIRTFYDKVFISKLRSYASMSSICYDFLDEFWNSPLHLCSQQGHSSCVQMLIREFGLSLEVMNAEGWHPKDLIQHEPVRLVYDEHFHKHPPNANLIPLQPKNPRADTQDEVNNLIVKASAPSQTSLMNRIALSRQIVKYFEVLTKTPYYVLKVNNSKQETVSKLVNSLTHAGFIVNQLQSASNSNHFFLTLDMSQDWLGFEA